MDEPFGALDARTREALQHELDRIRRESGCSIVFVTHDIWKALPLADRVVAMTAGPKAGIKTFEPVDLPHPRDQGGEECLALRRRLRDDLGEEVRHALERHGLMKEGALTRPTWFSGARVARHGCASPSARSRNPSPSA